MTITKAVFLVISISIRQAKTRIDYDGLRYILSCKQSTMLNKILNPLDTHKLYHKKQYIILKDTDAKAIEVLRLIEYWRKK